MATTGLEGQYVIVRCRDAGVLESADGRTAILTESRRLWYWKPAAGRKYLSGVAVAGLDSSSKVSAVVERIVLTEDCEIIACSDAAAKSIRAIEEDRNVL